MVEDLINLITSILNLLATIIVLITIRSKKKR